MSVWIINNHMNYDNLNKRIYSFRALICRYLPPVLPQTQWQWSTVIWGASPNQSFIINTLHFRDLFCSGKFKQFSDWVGNKMMKTPLLVLQSELTAGGNYRTVVGHNHSRRATGISQKIYSHKVCFKAWYNYLITQYHFLAGNWRQRSKDHCFHK